MNVTHSLLKFHDQHDQLYSSKLPIWLKRFVMLILENKYCFKPKIRRSTMTIYLHYNFNYYNCCTIGFPQPPPCLSTSKWREVSFSICMCDIMYEQHMCLPLHHKIVDTDACTRCIFCWDVRWHICHTIVDTDAINKTLWLALWPGHRHWCIESDE